MNAWVVGDMYQRDWLVITSGDLYGSEPRW